MTAKGPPILVLGGTGFIGSHLCRKLVQSGHAVRVFSRACSHVRSIADIESSVEVVRGDIGRPGDVLAAMDGASTLVHLVHTTVPGSSMADPVYDVQSNAVANVHWLQDLARSSISRVIYVSSGGTVYGNPVTATIAETHPTEPISSYGITKLALEKYVALFSTLTGRRHAIVRPSNVYGPGQRLDIGQGFIGVGLHRLLIGEPIEIWGDGTTVRDYLYVEDMVKAIIGLLSYNGPETVFNVGSGRGQSLREVTEEMLRATKASPSAVVYSERRTFDVPVNVLDITRIREAITWKPSISLREGIQRTAEWISALPT